MENLRLDGVHMETSIKEQWSRVQQLSKQEIAERQELFTKYQKEYNETHDKNIYWEKLYPLIVDCVKSNVLKVNQMHFVNNFEERCNDAVDLLSKRYLTKPNYNFKSLVTLCYFAAVWACRQKSVIHEDMEQSYEHLVDEMMMHENEHIIDFEDIIDYKYGNVDDLF